MVCIKCGKEVNHKMRFCSGCGLPVKMVDAEVSETAVEQGDTEAADTAVEQASDEASQVIVLDDVKDAPVRYWSPAIIGTVAVIVAAIVVTGVYVGVIRGKSYEAISFNIEGYKNEVPESAALESQES